MSSPTSNPLRDFLRALIVEGVESGNLAEFLDSSAFLGSVRSLLDSRDAAAPGGIANPDPKAGPGVQRAGAPSPAGWPVLLRGLEDELRDQVVEIVDAAIRAAGTGVVDVIRLGRGGFGQCFLVKKRPVRSAPGDVGRDASGQETATFKVWKVALPRFEVETAECNPAGEPTRQGASRDRGPARGRADLDESPPGLRIVCAFGPHEEAAAAAVQGIDGFLGAFDYPAPAHVLGLPIHEMAVADGETLFTSFGLEQELPFTFGTHPEDALALVRYLAQAIEALHARGFLHLDLTPRNILYRHWVRPAGAIDGVFDRNKFPLTLLDFGCAVPLPRKAAAHGTPMHATSARDSTARKSPARVSGWSLGYGDPHLLDYDGLGRSVQMAEKASPASDVYALGALLYLFATGQHFHEPLGTRDQAESLRRELPDLSRLALLPHRGPNGVDLRQIVETALQPNPRDRFQTATEFLRALEGKAVRHRCPPPRAYLERLTTRSTEVAPQGHTSGPGLEMLFTDLKCRPVTPPVSERLGRDRDRQETRSDEDAAIHSDPERSTPDPDDLDAPPKEALRIADAVQGHPRLAILGKGGIGKTTLTRQLVLSLAWSWKDEPPDEASGWSPGALRLTAAFPQWIPFRIVLRDFAEWVRLARGGAKEPRPHELAKIVFRPEDIRRYVIEEELRWPSTRPREADADQELVTLLQTYPSLFLFDGLDEIPGYEETKDATARPTLAAAIVEFGEWLDQLSYEAPGADDAPRAHVVVTCRPEAFIQPPKDNVETDPGRIGRAPRRSDAGTDPGGIGRLDTFSSTTLCGLGDEQIAEFVGLHCAVHQRGRGTDPAAGAQRAQSLVDRVLGEPRLRAVARVPLVLGLIVDDVSDHDDPAGDHLPDSIAGIFDRATERLIREWEQERTLFEGRREIPLPSISATMQLTPEQLRRAVERMAFTVQQKKVLGQSMDLSSGEIVDCLEHHCPDEHTPDWKVVRRYLVYRVGILVARTQTSFAFPHNVIREFLAACCLCPVQGGKDRTPQTEPGAREQQTQPPYSSWAEGVQALLLVSRDGWTLWAESFVRAAEFLHYQEEARNEGAGDDAVWRMVREILGVSRRIPASTGDADIDYENDIARRTYLTGELLSRVVTKEGRDDRLQQLDQVRNRHVALIRDERLEPPTRARAARNLGQLGDPRFHGPEGFYLPKEPTRIVPLSGSVGEAGREILGFIEIPAGVFPCGPHEDLVGTKYGAPERVHLDTYWIARYPVTNAQYAVFLQHGSEILASAFVDHGGPPRAGTATGSFDRHAPVAYVRWYDAWKYARWLELVLAASEPPQWLDSLVFDEFDPIREEIRSRRLRITLPTEEQWEKAARGPGGGEWPWSGRDERPPSQLANIRDTGIGAVSAVGCFPSGRSAYGIEELSGNVWEWTRSLWSDDFSTASYLPGGSDAPCRDGAPQRQDEGASAKWLRVVRGGSFRDGQRFARWGCRGGLRPGGGRGGDLGFRLVASPFLGSDL